MDLKQIEKLMSMMGRAGVSRLALREEGFEIELERETAGHFAYAPAPAPMPMAAPMGLPSHSTEEKKMSAEEKKEAGRFVTSPMVGTFYCSPSPDDPAYVKVGDEITENSVVCIIEAMKVMNEVKAGIRGKVVEILVKNGDPVEFGTKLLRIV